MSTRSDKTGKRPGSLHWRLVRNLLALQAVVFVLLLTLIIVVLSLNEVEDDAAIVDAVRGAVFRDAAGALAFRDTPDLAKLRLVRPTLWVVVRDQAGVMASSGDVPPEFRGDFGGPLAAADRATVSWGLGSSSPTASLKRLTTDAGLVQILAGTGERRQRAKTVGLDLDVRLEVAENAGGLETWLRILAALALVFVVSGILPVFFIMGAATMIATPIVVRRALGGLVETADHASLIDIDRLAVRLPIGRVPTEVVPLVQAVNRALDRLDEGYDRRSRFMADAAHELRTPITILQTRLELLPPSPERTRLIEDVARLALLAEQLLDLQRLDHLDALTPLDLVALARHVVEDMAPLAIGAGYDLAFEPEQASIWVPGDRISLEQALTNLIQNAIEHGGRKGVITVAVDGSAAVEVRDEGAGVPLEEHARIFEPFYRLHPRTTGAGLGLNLVREIAKRHQGRISVVDRPEGGACFRFALPRHIETPAPEPSHSSCI
ncbi:HAMP domain-containing sensor histidine kinase [Bradyrhizobium prioriisuperbiae]|uniref:sensor histidine kinase n=1 Tax=Bradyrhizobium prioriisuperbiae TaxID=2854389 RepID=UPI0028F05FB6|nr:HAMP domain-containing sensor histidine kinase [Bradyrhizobium prioritasuperba]